MADYIRLAYIAESAGILILNMTFTSCLIYIADDLTMHKVPFTLVYAGGSDSHFRIKGFSSGYRGLPLLW